MKKTVVLLLTLLLAFVLPSTAKLQTTMLPADTQWLLHFDMKEFTATTLGQFIWGDESGKLDQGRQKILQRLKIDLKKDIEAITVFGPGKGKQNTVVSISGTLDKDFLISLLKEKEKPIEIRHGKHTIYNWDRSEFGVFASDRLLLIGHNKDTITNVLDVLAGKAKNIKGSAIMSLVNEMPGDAFFKAAVENISDLAGDHSRAAILKKARMALFLALEKNDILKLALKLTTDSAETAKNIEQIVNGFLALVKLQQQKEKQDPRLKILESLKVSLKGNTVYLELSQPSKDFMNMISLGRHALGIPH